MSPFAGFVRKEFRHILRDRRTLLVLLGMPVVMIVLFGYTIRNDVEHASLAVLDRCGDNYSRQLVQRLNASAYFEVVRMLPAEKNIDEAFRRDAAQLVLIIPPRFGEGISHDRHAQLRLVADASNPNTATTLVNYASAIIRQFQEDMLVQGDPPPMIVPEVRMLYNPALESAYLFIPGVMTLILMLVSAMMTAITITREKELGTMEVLLVSPLPPPLIIVGKVVPYVLLSFINALLILGLGIVLFHVPVRGSLLLLLAESLLFILTALSLGILISTGTDSQQTAMMMAMGGLLMPTVLLSGFIFPLESMPLPLQWLANIIPAKWFILILKDIMLKGAGWSYVWIKTLVLLGMTAVFMLLSIKNFKTRLN